MQYLPSKKFIILILFVSLVGGGIFVVSYVLRIKTTFKQDNTMNTGQSFALNPQESPAIDEFLKNEEGDYAISASLNPQESAERMYDELFTKITSERVPETQNKSVATQGTKIIPTTQENLRNYGNAFMAVLKKYPHVTAEATLKELNVLREGPKNIEAVEALKNLETEYRALGKEIELLSVPEKMYPLHTEITKNIDAIGITIGYARTMASDPAQITLGINLYIALLNATTDLVKNIYNTFIESGVHFNENETGYAWYNFEPATSEQ